ncbi:hypothetical protein BV25DRAFT_1807146, partial [Artomyces pyxidatus]
PMSRQDLDTFQDRVFDAAVANRRLGIPPPRLIVQGEDIKELVKKWKDILAEAVAREDFTRVLSPERHFEIINRSTTPGDAPSLRSFGVGVEQEVISATWMEYQNQPAQYLAPRLDEHWSLAPTPLVDLAGISGRAKDLAVFGAVVATSIVAGLVPFPLSPVFLHFCLHDCDFNSITRDILKEWHPQFAGVMERWKEVGPTGSLEEFRHWVSSYADVDIVAIASRNEQVHESLGAMMVYRAILGNESWKHSDFRNFLKGFLLPCQNTFNFAKAVAAVEGGSEYFFSVLWSYRITGFSSLQEVLQIRLLASVPQNQRTVMLDGEGVPLEDIIKGFLQGQGIPIASEFDTWRTMVDGSVDLSLIDEPEFRPKAFHRAATGQEALQPNAFLMVYLVGDSDTHYPGDLESRERKATLEEGKISWRTCLGTSTIPVSYISRLASQNAQRPDRIRAAIYDWLLRETLTSIGSHGML